MAQEDFDVGGGFDMSMMMPMLLGNQGAQVAAASGQTAPTPPPQGQGPGTNMPSADTFLRAFQVLQAIQPPQTQIPRAEAIAPARANAQGINPAMLAQIQQMMQGAPARTPSLGALMRGGM